MLTRVFCSNTKVIKYLCSANLLTSAFSTKLFSCPKNTNVISLKFRIISARCAINQFYIARRLKGVLILLKYHYQIELTLMDDTKFAF